MCEGNSIPGNRKWDEIKNDRPDFHEGEVKSKGGKGRWNLKPNINPVLTLSSCAQGWGEISAFSGPILSLYTTSALRKPGGYLFSSTGSLPAFFSLKSFQDCWTPARLFKAGWLHRVNTEDGSGLRLVSSLSFAAIKTLCFRRAIFGILSQNVHIPLLSSPCTD